MNDDPEGVDPYRADALASYQRFDFDNGRWTRPVFRKGGGPAVIVIHEIPGLHPLMIRFADRIVEAGMSVYLPSLFGEPGRQVSKRYVNSEILKALCIRREFSAWASDRSSPIVDWLRALARQAHKDCGGRGVGAVGMCFTGNFAMAMMTEPAVVAPVMSQPSLPLAIGDARKAAIGLSPSEIACAKQRFKEESLSAMCLRFKGDPVVPDARIETFRRTFGDAIQIVELNEADARMALGRPHPHSVLTINLRDDDPDGPTRKTEERVIAFFKERTKA